MRRAILTRRLPLPLRLPLVRQRRRGREPGPLPSLRRRRPHQRRRRPAPRGRHPGAAVAWRQVPGLRRLRLPHRLTRVRRHRPGPGRRRTVLVAPGHGHRLRWRRGQGLPMIDDAAGECQYLVSWEQRGLEHGHDGQHDPFVPGRYFYLQPPSLHPPRPAPVAPGTRPPPSSTSGTSSPAAVPAVNWSPTRPGHRRSRVCPCGHDPGTRPSPP